MVIIPEKWFRTSKSDKQGHCASHVVLCAMHIKLYGWLIRRHEVTDVAVSVGAAALLPLVEVASQWLAAAAVLKYGWRKDLSSKLCGPVSSSEKR